MRIHDLIKDLQTLMADLGDIEVKLDIDGMDVDPDIKYYGSISKKVLYLW